MSKVPCIISVDDVGRRLSEVAYIRRRETLCKHNFKWSNLHKKERKIM